MDQSPGCEFERVNKEREGEVVRSRRMREKIGKGGRVEGRYYVIILNQAFGLEWIQPAPGLLWQGGDLRHIVPLPSTMYNAGRCTEY